MMTCLPASLCSWDYRVLGGDLGNALLRFNWMSEQGTITVNHVAYSVVKHGVMSGRWTLEQGGNVSAEATKPSALFRALEISGFGARLELKATSAFSRSFELTREGNVLGRIVPAHPLTRRATIEISEPVHEVLQLFSFWLVALMWKRASQNNSHGGVANG